MHWDSLLCTKDRHVFFVRDIEMTQNEEPKHHFLVIASASRGARYFVKKALRQGHDVTALCRAADDDAALLRMKELLKDTALTEGGVEAAPQPGTLFAKNHDILQPETYSTLLANDSSIDRVCCFVGVTTFRDMMSRTHQLYTRTIGAIVEGMRRSRWVELYYHGSSGVEGVPGQGIPQLPDNFYPKWLLNLGLKIPAAQNCFESEKILAQAEGLTFVIFRPAWLTSQPAKRAYGYCFDYTGMDHEQFPLRTAKVTIGREDVAEEILRVCVLPDAVRSKWHGHGVYLADKKS